MMINSRLLLAFAVVVLSITGFSVAPANAQYDDTYVSYNDFYQNLAPYGQWIDDQKYGYVWSPNVDASFRPYYTSGHWAMTDYGNTWISDYQWGWACFHYGRWTYDNYYGWLWIPGSEWGPAWVSWREGEGYYGWAPLSPDYAISASADYYCPNDWWVFIPPQYVYGGNYYHYWYGPRGNSTIIRNTHYIRNTYENNHVTYVTGPNAMQVQQTIHQPVQVFKLTNSNSMNTRVKDNTIKMYRPAQIRPTATINGQRVSPPNAVAAPQAVSKPQSTNGRTAATPEYKSDIPTPVRQDAIGTHANEAVRAQPRQSNTTNAYEYDVNRHITQPQPGEYVPQQQPVQQARPVQTAPVQQPLSRPQPPVMRESVRQAPVPSMPAPQRAAAPTPTPVQATPHFTAPAQAQPARQAAPAPNQQAGGRR